MPRLWLHRSKILFFSNRAWLRFLCLYHGIAFRPLAIVICDSVPSPLNAQKSIRTGSLFWITSWELHPAMKLLGLKIRLKFRSITGVNTALVPVVSWHKHYWRVLFSSRVWSGRLSAMTSSWSNWKFMGGLYTIVSILFSVLSFRILRYLEYLICPKVRRSKFYYWYHCLDNVCFERSLAGHKDSGFFYLWPTKQLHQETLLPVVTSEASVKRDWLDTVTRTPDCRASTIVF